MTADEPVEGRPAWTLLGVENETGAAVFFAPAGTEPVDLPKDPPLFVPPSWSRS